MKTILVLTDFSIRADHAAHYALRLAQKIGANLLLCNIFQAPVAKPLLAGTPWPIGNFEEDSLNDLKELTARLNKQLDSNNAEGEFRPAISQCSKAGSVADEIGEITSKQHLLMAVISMHYTDGFSPFLLGNNASGIIDRANCPVLVVPYQMPFNGFRKIVFATDLTRQNGVDVLRCLSGLAKYADSEIIITYVADKNATGLEEQSVAKQFFNDEPFKIAYPKINYSIIRSKNVTAGLEWLTENTDTDLLVLVHRKRNFFQKLFEGSVTQNLADHLIKPILVFPGTKVQQPLPVF